MNHRFPAPSRSASWALLCILHLILAVIFLMDRSPGTDAAVTGFPLDDAWIHMVYGRELAYHGLPYYNTGELEAGFTSPVWLVGVACAELLDRIIGVSAVATVKALGVLAATAASLLVFELNLALTGNLLISLVVAGLAAGTPVLAFSQVSGMEVGLAAVLMLAAIVALDRRRYGATGIFSALAYLTRPECVVIVPPLLLGIALTERGSTRTARIIFLASLRVVLPILAAAAAWALYCLVVTGHPLPNTFYAKFLPVNRVENLSHMMREIILELPLAYGMIGGLLSVAGGVAFAWTKRGAGLAILLLPWLFLAGVAASRTMPDGCGTYFYWWRYTLPVLPALAVPIAAGAQLLWRFGGGGRPGAHLVPDRARRAIAALVLVLLCMPAVSRYPRQIAFRKQQFSWNCQNLNEVQVAFGRWVNMTVPPAAAVFVNDAGAIRYFGRRRTIDLIGLNNHDLVFNKRVIVRLLWDASEMARLMSGQGATHLLIFPAWFPRLTAHPLFPSLFNTETAFHSTNYTVTSGRQATMVAYRLIP